MKITKEQAIQEIEAELGNLLAYAERVREDWSDFDGRSLLSRVDGFIAKVRGFLAVLK